MTIETAIKLLPQDVTKAVLGTIPNGQYFTVTFVKANGETRVMTCQKGVHKHVKGTGRANSNPNIQRVYEAGVEGYRSFDTRRVVTIKARGVEVTPTAT